MTVPATEFVEKTVSMNSYMFRAAVAVILQ